MSGNSKADQMKKMLREAFSDIATKEFEKAGVVFGKRQTVADIDVASFSDYPDLMVPERCKTAEFVPCDVTVQGAGMGSDMKVALWVIPFLKSGKEGQAIKLIDMTVSKPSWY